ncbi:S1-like domain-containing RNA-binding protein [Halocola ammonii]
MAKPGKYVNLEIKQIDRDGFHLDNDGETILLPSIETPAGKKEGEQIEVFLFVNAKGETQATTEKPLILLNEVQPLIAVKNTEKGAFFDMGIQRDLFVPPTEQKIPIEAGKRYLVVMKYDRQEHKLYGATRLKPYFRDERLKFEKNEKVNILIVKKIEEGFEVIINMKVFGFLHDQDATIPNMLVGQRYNAYIKEKDRDRYNVSLQKDDPEQLEKAAEKIYEFVVNNKGYVRLNDNTEPEEIKLRLHMSKKLFKKAIGKLYKENRIVITKRGIKLSKE